jgi:hypothetical protein
MKTFLAGVGLALQFTSAVAAEKMTVAYATLGPALSPGWVTSDKGIRVPLRRHYQPDRKGSSTHQGSDSIHA